MLIDVNPLDSLCIFIDADSTKTRVSYAMYEKNEHLQRKGQNFTTQKCVSQKDEIEPLYSMETAECTFQDPQRDKSPRLPKNNTEAKQL